MMSLSQIAIENFSKHIYLKSCKCAVNGEYRWVLFCTSLIVIFLLGSCGMSLAEGDWSATLYGAVLLKGNLSDASILNTGFEDSHLAVLAVTRKMASYRDKIDFELEGQIVKHFKEQQHWEFNGLGTARWLPFPWDHFLDTNFAFGAGLSFATETPKVEEKRRGDGETQQVLAYLMLELEMALPDAENWSLVSRIHHRSGAFGLFNGVTGGSNAWGIGIKYRF